jgi:hypothetical protein
VNCCPSRPSATSHLARIAGRCEQRFSQIQQGRIFLHRVVGQYSDGKSVVQKYTVECRVRGSLAVMLDEWVISEGSPDDPPHGVIGGRSLLKSRHTGRRDHEREQRHWDDLPLAQCRFASRCTGLQRELSSNTD